LPKIGFSWPDTEKYDICILIVVVKGVDTGKKSEN